MSRKSQVQAITSVGRPLSEDVHGRATRYLVSMAIRTACFVGIYFTDGWLRWAMAVGAIVVPYIAVVAANAGKERPKQADTLIETPDGARPQIEAPPRTFPPVDLRGGYLR